MIRVIHIKWKLSSDGATKIILDMAETLQGKIVVDWLLLGNPQNDIWAYKFERLGSRIYHVPASKYKLNRLKFYLGFFKVHHYDIIHINTDAIAYEDLLYAAKYRKVKCRIIHSHNSYCENLPRYMRYGLVKNIRKRIVNFLANEYIACSYDAAKWLFTPQNAKKALILKNGIDTDRFAFSNESRKIYREKLEIENELVIGHVGRFEKVKNHKFLIDIFYAVLYKLPTAKLLLIGDGSLKKDIEKKVKNFGIEKNVIFVGLTDEVEKYMCAMDVLVLPSLFEGLSIVGIEAQANGLPCVVSASIPKVVKISDLLDFEPLKSSAGQWAEKIIIKYENSKKNIGNRKFASLEVKEKGYEINESSGRLLEVYDKYVNV
jgi:glycosyltransferase involved in cell wall biosynthesis